MLVGTVIGAGASNHEALGLDRSGRTTHYYIDPAGVTGNARDAIGWGFTKAAPLRTLAGFYALYPYEMRNGSVAILHLAGAASTTGDPWDAPTGTAVQDYPIAAIDIGGGASLGNNFVVRGPTQMILATGLATGGAGPWTLAAGTIAERCDAAGVANGAGRFTRIDPDTGLAGWANWTANDLRDMGAFVRLRRAGVNRMWELPVFANTTTGVIVNTLNVVGNLLATDSLEIVVPAVRLLGTTAPAASSTVQVNGYGTALPVATVTGDAGHTFEMLAIHQVIVVGQGVTWDRCLFQAAAGADAFILRRGLGTFVNCQCDGGVQWCGDTLTLPAAPSSRLSAAGVPAITTAILELNVVGTLEVGEPLGGSPGHYRSYRNVGVSASAAAGLRINQGSSYREGTGSDLVGLGNTNAGVYVAEEGKIYTLTGTPCELTGTDGNLKVGNRPVETWATLTACNTIEDGAVQRLRGTIEAAAHTLSPALGRALLGMFDPAAANATHYVEAHDTTDGAIRAEVAAGPAATQFAVTYATGVVLANTAEDGNVWNVWYRPANPTGARAQIVT